MMSDYTDRLVGDHGVTDREAALIEAFVHGWAICPYALKGYPDAPVLEGGHGPGTCNMGCHDEPACYTSGPFPLHEYPDLCVAVAVALKEAETW